MKYWFAFLCLSLCASMHISEARGLFTPANSAIQLPAELTATGETAIGSTLWKSGEVHSTLTNREEDPNVISEAVIFGHLKNNTPLAGDISATNIRGIGVRWKATWRANNFPYGKTMSITNPAENSAGAAGYSGSSRYVQTIWLELVKTGPIQNGNLSVTNWVEASFFCYYAACRTWQVTASGTTRVSAAPVCSASPSIHVPMPPWILGGDSVASRTAHFKIVLSCAGGGTDTFTRPLVSLTDANDPGNTGNTLALDRNPDAATGIGIQILRDGKPLALGPRTSTAQQWEAGTIEQGTSTYEIALEARYVKTGAAVSPGIANGRALFTLDYQ